MAALNTDAFEVVDIFSQTVENIEQFVNSIDAGDIDTFTKLLSSGKVDVNAQFYIDTMEGRALQFTLLSYAVKKGQLEIIRLLLDAGASPNKATKDGAYPLHFVAKAGEHSKEIALLLIGKGAQINVRPSYINPILIAAVKASNASVVEVLLDAGADPNVRRKDGRGDWTHETPLFFAVQLGLLPIIKLLVEHGAPVNQPPYRAVNSFMSEPINSPSLLIVASLSLEGEIRDAVVGYLIEKGADVNAVMEKPMRVWYVAEILAEKGSVKGLRAALREGATLRPEMLSPKGKMTLETANRNTDRVTLRAIYNKGKMAAATRKLKEKMEAAGGEKAFEQELRNKMSKGAAGKGGARRKTRGKKRRGNA